MMKICVAALLSALCVSLKGDGDFEIVSMSGRKLRVKYTAGKKILEKEFDVPLGKIVKVENEFHATVKSFNPHAAPWQMNVLQKTRSMECNTPDSYVPGSLRVKKSADADAELYEEKKDYLVNDRQGIFARNNSGKIGETVPVWVTYEYAMQRIDSIILDDGKLAVVRGKERVNNPQPPELYYDSEVRLANIWVKGASNTLDKRDILIIDEKKLQLPDVSAVGKLCFPRTLEKLRNGKKVRIVAWGDSITNGGYLPEKDRWTTFFINGLRELFPAADIEFSIVGWGGATSTRCMEESAGTIYDYQKKVLDVKADLVISEFMNDCGLKPERMQLNYQRMLEDFRAAGSEWIVMTPCYNSSNADSPEDSRKYIGFVRDFCKKNNIAVADAALYYGKLRYAGIPFVTTLVNSVNHPDARGMMVLACSVLDLFAEKNNQGRVFF